MASYCGGKMNKTTILITLIVLKVASTTTNMPSTKSNFTTTSTPSTTSTYTTSSTPSTTSTSTMTTAASTTSDSSPTWTPSTTSNSRSTLGPLTSTSTTTLTTSLNSTYKTPLTLSMTPTNITTLTFSTTLTSTSSSTPSTTLTSTSTSTPSTTSDSIMTSTASTRSDSTKTSTPAPTSTSTTTLTPLTSPSTTTLTPSMTSNSTTTWTLSKDPTNITTSMPSTKSTFTITTKPSTTSDSTTTSTPSTSSTSTTTTTPSTTSNSTTISTPSTTSTSTMTSTPSTTSPSTTTPTPSTTSTSTTTSIPSTILTIKSTSTPSTTSTITTTSTHSMTSQKPGGYPISYGKANLTVKVEASVSIALEFTDELNNKSSEKYINLSYEFSVQLKKLYNKIDEFDDIEILGFSEGSTICHYKVHFKATVNLTAVVSHIRNSIIKVNNLDVDMNASAEALSTKATSRNLCEIIEDPCGGEKECKQTSDGIECIDTCKRSKLVCGENKECYYDTVLGRLGCSCKWSEDAMFGGPDCTRRVEILPLSSSEIITIAAASSGVVVAIFMTVIVVLIVRNKKLKSKAKSGDEGSTFDQDQMPMKRLYPEVPSDEKRNEYVSESGLHRGDNLGRKWQGVANGSYYNGQRQSPNYIPDGDKDYAYPSPRDQPYFGDHPSPGETRYSEDLRYPEPRSTDYQALRKSSSNLSRTCFYDVIDTTMKFEIRRPSIRTNKFY